MTHSSPISQANQNQRPRENDWRLFLRLVPYARRTGRLLFVSMALLLPLSIASAVQPLIIGQAISLIRSEDQTWSFVKERSLSEGLSILIGLLLLTIVIRLAFVSVQGFLVAKLGQQMTAWIRDDLFDHVTSLAARFFDRTPVGRLITRLTSDVEALGDVFSTGAIGIIGDVLSILVIAITMFFLQWQLALMLVLMLVPVTGLIIYFQQEYRKANYKAREELSALNSMLQENISGINIVQLFRREQFNAEVFREVNNRYIKEVDKTIFHDSAVSATLEWIGLVAIAAVLWMGGQRVLAGNLNFGTLSAFILFAQRLFDPLRQFAEKFTAIQAGFTAVERINDILNEPIEIKDPTTGKKEEHNTDFDTDTRMFEVRGKSSDGSRKNSDGSRAGDSPWLITGHPETTAYNLSPFDRELADNHENPASSEYRLLPNNPKLTPPNPPKLPGGEKAKSQNSESGG